MCPAFKISGHLFLFFLLSFLFSQTTLSSTNYLHHYCLSSTVYNPNSTYRDNLNQLFLNLFSNSNRENGFYSFTVGHGPPDTVYSLFLCRGDVNTDVCQECVKAASAEILQRCPVEKKATIFYDECMLRYANESVINRVDQSVRLILYNTGKITNQLERFEHLLGRTMSEVATGAANDVTTGKKLATKVANFTAFQTLYTLAQCTPDLSSNNCNTCLRDCIQKLSLCCNKAQGGRVLFPSCNIRYEMYPFYDIKAPAPVPTQRKLPPPPSNHGNGGGVSRKVIIAIVVLLAVSLVLFSVVCFLLSRGRMKTIYDSVDEGKDEASEITILLATKNGQNCSR